MSECVIILSCLLGENVSCHEDEFHCDNNKCKPLMWRCDGEDDCGDSSDEDPELCGKRPGSQKN